VHFISGTLNTLWGTNNSSWRFRDSPERGTGAPSEVVLKRGDVAPLLSLGIGGQRSQKFF